MAPAATTSAWTQQQQHEREQRARSESSGSWSGEELSSEEEAALEQQAWRGVKTWSFAQMFSGKVTLEDDRGTAAAKPSASASKPARASYTSLTSELARSASASSSSSWNDWDCGLSASSSSSTLCADAEHHQQQQQQQQSQQQEPQPRAAGAKDANRCCAAPRVELDMLQVVGSGSYGTVVLCAQRGSASRQLYAVKIVDKSKLRDYRDRRQLSAREVRRLRTEQRVLSSVSHPFITKLYGSFETRESLHFVLEYCPGGDMYFLLEKFPGNRLPERHVVFYAASIALALSYLHRRGIMYRDLKPENLLLDRDGFLRLADFGFARPDMARGERCSSFCGSADYIAPELARGAGYGLSADLWSLGCVVFELLSGFPPFYSPRDRAQLFRKIKHEAPVFPSHFSKLARDLVAGLLHKDAAQRLGSGPLGFKEVFAHPFFASVDWYALAAKQVTPPLVPQLESELDTRNFEQQFTSQRVDGRLVFQPRDAGSKPAADSDSDDDTFLFDDFDWCADDAFLP